MTRKTVEERNRITNVRIKNFRCFEDFCGDLEKLTSIVGENGCGKTSVLEAINMAMRSGGSRSFSLSDFRDSADIPIQIEVTTRLPFIVKVVDFPATRDIQCDRVQMVVKRRAQASAGRALSDPFVVTRYGVPINDPLLYREVEGGWEMDRVDKSKGVFQFTTRHLAMTSENTENLPNVFYFGKNREMQSKAEYNTTMSRILDEYNWRFRHNADDAATEGMADLWQQLYETAIANVGDTKHDAVMGGFIGQAQEVLGNDYSGLELASFGVLSPFQDAALIQRDGVHQLGLGSMGSGISMVLTLLLLENVSRLGEQKQDLVFLIDEPEMHLHPQLQERLRTHLADTPHQVLYTTHSPLMVSLGDWRSVRRVDRRGHFLPTREVLNETTPAKNGDELPFHGWLDDMTATKKKHVTTLLRENNELLFAEKVVLVEGAADKHCLRVLPEVTGHDIGNITPIVCGGKGNIPDYQILCRVFGVPFFTVYDEDTGDGEDANQSDRIRRLGDDGNLHGFSPSMEQCFGIMGDHDKGMKTIKAIETCAFGEMDAQVADLLDKLQAFASAP